MQQLFLLSNRAFAVWSITIKATKVIGFCQHELH